MNLLYGMLFVGAALAALVLACSAWSQRALPGALGLGWLSLAMSEWLLAYALELWAPDLASKLWWAKLQYIGIVFVPVLWSMFTAQVVSEQAQVAPARGYRWPALAFLHIPAAAFMLPRAAGADAMLGNEAAKGFSVSLWSGRWRFVLLIIPVLTLILALTNDSHHLLWSSVSLLAGDSVRALSLTHGPWFWIHTTFSYFLLLVGSVQLARGGASHLGGQHVVLLLTGALLPWAADALYLARVAPPYPLDLTPLAFALSVLLFSWSLLRFSFLRIVPFTQRAILEHLNDGAFVLDPWQRIVAINPAAELILGITWRDATGQPIGRVLADHTALLELCLRPVETRSEIAFTRPAGQLHYDVHCAPLSGWRGQRGERLILLRNITQRKRALEAHRFVSDASRLLASSLDYETALTTLARQLLPALADWCMVDIFGLDQTSHFCCSVAVDPGKQALLDCLLREDCHALRAGQSQLIADLPAADSVDLPDDARELLRQVGVCSTIIVPLNARGRLLGTLLFGSIGSDRRYGLDDLDLAEDLASRIALAVDNARLFEVLRASIHLKSELLAHVSHEIRTPISGVLGMTELLLETNLADDQRDYATSIRTGGNALLAVVNGMLDFSKIEAGRLELEQAPFDLLACIEESIDMVARMAADRSLDLAYAFESTVPARLIGDMARLRQVLVNLLSNALKFTHHGGVLISVAADMLDDRRYELRFSVADSGVGIPAGRLQEVFTPFSQLGGATYRRYGGTGLGLAISQRLVELMDGRIWVESEAGVGSTFFFTIRAVADADMLAIGQPVPPLLAGKRILIVDPHRRSRQAVVAFAEAWGMLPFAAVSAHEALAWIRQGQLFDVAIVDVLNSDLSGLALISEISRYHDPSTLPAILMELLGRKIEPRITAEDYHTILHKPIRMLQLQAALINVFQKRAVHTAGMLKRPHHVWSAAEASPRILLAEDDALNQQVLRHLLQKLGYWVDLVRDGDLALQAFEQQAYDVVLLDLQMPSMDGLEVARAIRRRWPVERQPYIVAITATVAEGVREMCLGAGMDNFISKPIHVAELMQVIEMYQLRARPDASPGGSAADLQVDWWSEPERVDLGDPTRQADLQLSQRAMLLQSDLVGLFFEDSADLLNVMLSAAALGDLHAIERCAHRLKSSSALVGAPVLSELCEQLELAIRTNAPIDLHEQVEQIALEFGRVRVALAG